MLYTSEINYGIILHSNSLSAIGAATLSINALRIFWIVAQQLDQSLRLRTLRLIVPSRELRTRRLLVPLYYSVRDHIHDRELLLSARDLAPE
jgi:hypothetical protein